jgi:NAD(P)-dependent dehydrogenase (short-subunit alcohol dehydrogenase family)
MQTLDGKNVSITGANGDLGRAVTQAFLDAGAKVGGAAHEIQDSDFSSPNFMALSGEVSTAAEAAWMAESRANKILCTAFRCRK